MGGWMEVWLRRLAWLVGIVLVLVLAAWLGIPALIKWQAPPRLSTLLGRTVTIGDVGFKPWNLTLTVDQFAIAGLANGDAPLLKIGHVLVDASIESVFRLAPVIRAIEVDAPELRVARTSEGHYDIDDLIARFTPTQPESKPGEPAHFALYNLQVRDGLLSFDDRPVKQVQKIEALHLALPFISNLPAQVDIKVEPHLAFKLNGTPFDSGAQATPFAQTRAGELKLTMADLDLAPYLGYLPASLPVRVLRGSVSADLGVNFAVPAGATPNVTVRGSASAKNLALADAAGAPLLEWKGLQLGLRDVQPLARKLAFDKLRVDGLQLHATRDAAGHVNLLGLTGPASEKGPANATAAATAAAAPASSVGRAASSAASGAPSSASSGTAATTAATTAAPGAWQVELDALSLADTRVFWNDAAVQPAAALSIDGLSIDAKKIQWPIKQPIALSLNGSLHPQAAGAPAGASFTVDGPVTDSEAKLKIAFKGLSLASFAPYAAQSLKPTLDGQLAAQAELDWSGLANAPRLKLAIDEATLDQLALREGSGKAGQDVLTLKQLALADTHIDLLARTAVLGRVKLMQPSVVVEREADGGLNLQRWTVPEEAKGAAKSVAKTADKAATQTAAKAADPAASSAAALTNDAWRVQVKDLLLDEGAVKFSDASVGKPKAPMRFEVGTLRLAVQGFEWHGDQATAPGAVQLSARLGMNAASGRGKPRDGPRVSTATIDYKGRVGIAPLLANGKLSIERFPVQLFAPYFADKMKLALLNAEAGYKGDVGMRQSPAGLDVDASGDVLLGGVRIGMLPAPNAASATDPGAAEDLLSWQSFKLSGVKFAMKPKTKPQLEIAEAALTDFYSRLVVTEQGRLNLQDVTGRAASPSTESAAAAAPAEPASAAASAPAIPSGAASAAAPVPAEPLPIDVKVGITKLINGRIDFSDHFVRPNYSAALTELNGQLGAFSSTSSDAPALELHGRAEGSALLEISGKVNPTARPLALDIQAKATDLELAPLSPYAGKYAGYAIERGKLTMDIAYKIDPDGRLEARNQVVLNQLTFGDKIESKDATKLPVLLAVALLKDRNGVIDINLPISGSLKDPQFSIGGIIFKVIVNLLAKALTSPFALLTGGGGGDDLSVVDFQPGTALFTPAGSSAVDKVAKALVDRPALKMTVTGAADPASERDAFQAAVIESRINAEARQASLRAGAAPAAPASAASGVSAAASAPVVLPEAEHTRLLTRLYKDTEIPDKPRNALGFAKEIPPAEMVALLKPRMPVSDDAMRELALQRGLAVRDALISKGLTSDRLFLAAPTLRATAGDATPWTPRVQLSLTTR